MLSADTRAAVQTAGEMGTRSLTRLLVVLLLFLSVCTTFAVTNTAPKAFDCYGGGGFGSYSLGMDIVNNRVATIGFGVMNV